MTREEIIEALRSAPTTEVDTGRTGKVRQTPLLIAYNGNESWTFHAIEVGGVYSFVATQMLPCVDADIKFDNVPEHVFNMEFEWSSGIIEKYGDIGTAMRAYGENRSMTAQQREEIERIRKELIDGFPSELNELKKDVQEFLESNGNSQGLFEYCLKQILLLSWTKYKTEAFIGQFVRDEDLYRSYPVVKFRNLYYIYMNFANGSLMDYCRANNLDDYARFKNDRVCDDKVCQRRKDIIKDLFESILESDVNDASEFSRNIIEFTANYITPHC